jgi:hypothetical protein
MTRERHQIHYLFIWLVVACISGLINFCNIVGAKAEHWSDADRPLKFASDLILTLEDLPSSGEAANIPWTGNYWPTYKDSINQPWAGPGTTPPSQKYAAAFGHNANHVMNQVSLYHGIDSQNHRNACTHNSDCTSILGLCSKRSGHSTGYCIPTWFGINHAWASAALLLHEPRHEVEYNGVNFKINDLKALITLLHDRIESRFVSLRCNTDASAVQLDNYGRPTGVDSECRDTNPGTLHVLLANYLGIRGASFVEDRTWDDEVWNQPIRGYRVTRQEEVTASEANQLIGVVNTGGVTIPASSSVAKNQWFHMDPIAVEVGQNITVKMTGTDDADLYVRFGNQPTIYSYDCRPYKGGSDETCDLIAPYDTQVYIAVLGYAASSDFFINAAIGQGIPNDYQFNRNADHFYHVQIEVDYIGMSSSQIDGNLRNRINQYTHTDTYDYVLELKTNSAGKQEIIGGEYIGASKQNHPDFLWLPISLRGTSVAGGQILRSEVMTLYEKSQQTDDSSDAGVIKTVVYHDTLAKNDVKHYGPFNVKTGHKLAAIMTGSHDADLYVRSGAVPTKSAYDCRPYKNGSNEECHIVSTGAPIHVAVMGYAALSDFTLHIEYTESKSGLVPINPPVEVNHLNVRDSVAQGGSKHYTIDLPAGYATRIQTFSSGDVDLYIQVNKPPTTSEYLMRVYTSTGNETINYSPQSNITLHIMVHGYQAASFTLRTAPQ